MKVRDLGWEEEESDLTPVINFSVSVIFLSISTFSTHDRRVEDEAGVVSISFMSCYLFVCSIE
jgi:hypothetical protein